jgi:hypothetical protein
MYILYGRELDCCIDAVLIGACNIERSLLSIPGGDAGAETKHYRSDLLHS